jgi:hypothetical protein
MTPWVLFPEAASLSAHVRHGVRGPVATLRDSLVEKTRRLLSEETTFLDYPMTGSLLCALGLWELTRDDPGPLAVRLLVLADGFGYNRMLPSLGWRYAADLAESRFPGMADAYAAEIAGRSAVELRDDVRRVVAQLD